MLLIAILNGLGNYLQIRSLNRASILVVFVAYLFMAWALAHHRVFNARHVLAAVGHRLAVVGVLAVSSWAVSVILLPILGTTAAWIVGTALCAIVVFWLDQSSRQWVGLGGERLLAALRRDVILLSQREAGSQRLTSEFEHLLADRHRARVATILSNHGDKYLGRNLEFSTTRPGFNTLCESAWITPESLQRRRTSPGLADLGVFLERNALGVIVTAPRGSPTPSLLVTIGTRTNEWPFTYPDVERLQHIAELMDSILTRSRLTDQAAMRTRMEHLAMMSRGLAHDLKNLITPVSSFLVHTEGNHPEGSAAAEVHAAARRSIRIMTDYLRETLFFSERLEPRFETVDLPHLLQHVRETAEARAARRGVLLAISTDYSGSFRADGVLLQRMLVNLVNNAIDASASGQKVALGVGFDRPNWLRFQIHDSGRGIPPGEIDQIFDPYFTTKEFGDEMRGFGLGLTIAQKIIELHLGTIDVQSKPGQGTLVTVEIPTGPKPPPASAPLPPASPAS